MKYLDFNKLIYNQSDSKKFFTVDNEEKDIMKDTYLQVLKNYKKREHKNAPCFIIVNSVSSSQLDSLSLLQNYQQNYAHSIELHFHRGKQNLELPF